MLVGHLAAQGGAAREGDLVQRALLGGTFGVALFFALSGYLLYLPFARRDFDGGRELDLGRYARNRALRILPLYYVSVVVVLALEDASWSQWWRSLLFAQNVSRETVGEVHPVLWSIVVEVQFYAVLPLLALAVARFAGGSRSTAVSCLCLLGAASFVLYGLSDDLRWRTGLPALLFFFVAGMLVAIVRVSRTEPLPGSPAVWLGVSLPIWLAVAWRHELAALSAVAGFLVVGAVVLPLRGRRVRAALAWRPLALVGVASYSLYIWHLPIVEAVPGAVAVALSLAAAFASYVVIESPFLRLRRRWR